MDDVIPDKIETLEIYQLSRQLGNLVGDEVSNWKYFQQKTIGLQLVRATDSIGANISEGLWKAFLQ